MEEIKPVAVSTEQDPNGKDPHQPGAKLDSGKLRAGLVLGDFSRALESVTRIGTFGANKYTASGWIEVPEGEARYTDAMWRHLLQDAQGLDLDTQSGLDHFSHFVWNALAVLELRLRRYEQRNTN